MNHVYKALINGFINDNLCISDVFGWDFNLITQKVFVTCVCQLNTMFFFLYKIEDVPRKRKMVFGVPSKNCNRCPRKSDLS